MEEPVPCGRDVEDRRRPDKRTRLGRAKERRGTGKGMSERKKERRECNGSEKQSETYELILIGGDSGEYGLREYEGLVRLLLEVHDRLRRARVRPLHQMDPRLVLVHRVQHQLQIIQNCITLPEMRYNGTRSTNALSKRRHFLLLCLILEIIILIEYNYCKKYPIIKLDIHFFNNYLLRILFASNLYRMCNVVNNLQINFDNLQFSKLMDMLFCQQFFIIKIIIK